MNPTNITANINSIPLLNGSNFKSWKENLEIVLGVMDLDLALSEDCPLPLTDKSTSDNKRKKERWEKLNRIYMMIMKKAILEAFRIIMSEKITTTKDFLADIEKRYDYIYLLHEKSQALNVFKNYKAEVENEAKRLKLSDPAVVVSTMANMTTQVNNVQGCFLEECGKKPNLKHLHVWGCPAEARRYRPNEKKLDLRTVSCYFIGYSERSRGYKFYDLRTKSIFESGNAWFFEDVELAGGDNVIDFVFENEYVNIPIEIVQEEQALKPQEPIPLKRSTRERSALSNDYIVFLQEHEVDIGVMEDDPINFRQAIESSNSQKWIDAMNEEIKSIKDNDVWDLVPLPEGVKPIGCKWIFKTNRDSKGDVERYKARLVAKGFTQKEGIDYKDTFSPISSKDSFRIIMALVAHFNLELHQMDVKTAFLNGDIDETIYMVQPENFISGDPKNMVCKLKKSIYGLKQTSRQWYFKFHQVIISFGFEMNLVDDCIYHKFCDSKYIFLVLYIDDILLASNNTGL
ncbi:Retrovirus-related Pol polyprotein from transposon TNT 1-94 [Melia azedarach]|uniref:Retrovirus-related Pol polyprotein from transposon TNT 1-94 n=1 Tax=Melia azedarach TaxID=155640 RepID=A0ACC1XQZ8_MELAZ|nr:Retrovirus-related Pol polyprotein from transposon TNT 1-94 [Melia azedarach]